MANVDLPVSELDAVTTVADSDLLYTVASGVSKKVTKQNLLKEINQALPSKADLVGGKVPASELPSYVDDVIEGYYDENADKFYEDAQHTTEITPETGKIYVDLTDDKSYRWSGSTYVCIGGGLELGETQTTAYRGDRGKTAYDHATDANRNTSAKALGLYKMAVTSEGHVSNPTAVQASDITSLVDVDKVKQSPSTTNSDYEILLSGSADNTEHTEHTKKSSKIKGNPSTGDITIGGQLTDKYGVQSIRPILKVDYDLLPQQEQETGWYLILDADNPLDVQLWNKVGTDALDTTAQDLSGAVNEINSSLTELKKHSFGTTITLTDDTEYITLSDGYLRIRLSGSPASANQYVYGYVNGEVMITINTPTSQTQTGYAYNSIFVRKGTPIKYTGTSSAQAHFLPMDS